MAASDPTVDSLGIPKRVREEAVSDDDDGLYPCARLLKVTRSCKDFVCKRPHFVMPFGVGLWQVNSVKINRNMEHPNSKSDVSIYGAVRLLNAGQWVDYVFRQPENEPIVFEKPGETLTLPLKGPSVPWVFMDDLSIAFVVVCVLKYNNASLFDTHGFDPTSTVLEGSPSKYTAGDCVGCADLFGEDRNNLGYEMMAVSNALGRKSVKRWVYGEGVILSEVASVELELESVVDGSLGIVTFTPTHPLMLHGIITARSCRHNSGIILFEKNANEAVPVKSYVSIPLSRNITIADSRTFLIIEAHLHDVNDSDFHVNETLLFNYDKIPAISNGTMAGGVIKVEVESKVPYYDGPVGTCMF